MVSIDKAYVTSY